MAGLPALRMWCRLAQQSSLQERRLDSSKAAVRSPQ